jgi:hypothetical protein
MNNENSVGYLNTMVALVQNLLNEFVSNLDFEAKLFFALLAVIVTVVVIKYRPAV